MSAAAWDASITLLEVVDPGTQFAINLLGRNASFDVLGNVEVGDSLHQFADSDYLFVWLRNTFTNQILDKQSVRGPLTPDDGKYRAEVRVPFTVPNGGWNAADGDQLEVFATYKALAGINSDYSSACGGTIIVVA